MLNHSVFNFKWPFVQQFAGQYNGIRREDKKLKEFLSLIHLLHGINIGTTTFCMVMENPLMLKPSGTFEFCKRKLVSSQHLFDTILTEYLCSLSIIIRLKC